LVRCTEKNLATLILLGVQQKLGSDAEDNGAEQWQLLPMQDCSMGRRPREVDPDL
jgi:hypothetical protein